MEFLGNGVMFEAQYFELAGYDLPNPYALLFFVLLVLWWATVRPAMVKDYDNRRLVPNPKARIIFAIIYLAVYTALVVLFLASGRFAEEFAQKITFIPPALDPLKAAFKEQAPLLAAFTLGGLTQLAIVRELERSVLVALHAARDLYTDRHELALHLAKTEFRPNAEEQYNNEETAARFGVFVTEASAASGLVTFDNWLKVATLSRLVRQWNKGDNRILTEEDMDDLAELEESHERKTGMAMNIIKMVDPLSSRNDAHAPKPSTADKDAAPERAHTQPAATSPPRAIEEVEEQVSEMLSAKAPPRAPNAPVHLTGDEFVAHLKQIERYFRREYEVLLANVSQMASKSVLQSGADAPERLASLRNVGFAGLGKIEPINFDRILLFFIVIAFGGFMVLFLGNFGEKYSPIGWDALARLSLIMTVATLIGAIVGSSRIRNADATPWTRYFAAGLIAAVTFFAVQSVSGLIKDYSARKAQAEQATSATPMTEPTTETPAVSSPNAGATSADASAPNDGRQNTATTKSKGKSVFSAYKTIPWMFLPFFVTVAICRLGQMPGWPTVPGLQNNSELTERLFDGLAIAIIIYFAYVMTIASYEPLGLDYSKRFQRALAQDPLLPVPIRWPIEFLGFLIGFVVLHDVRRAAHTKIIDNPA